MDTKKILAGVCAGLMVCSLVACGKTEPEITQEPAQKVETTQETEATTPIDNSEISEEVLDANPDSLGTMPNLQPSSQPIDYTTSAGVHLQGNMTISPLKMDTFNPDVTMQTLKSLDFVKDMAITNTNSEHAYQPVIDGQKLVAFQKTEIISISQIGSDSWLTGNYIDISYEKDSTSTINYGTISVLIQTQPETEFLTDEQIHTILKVVYGDEIGTYLFNGQMMSYEECDYASNISEYGEILYTRNHFEYQTYYGVTCAGSDYVEGYPGEEEMWAKPHSTMFDFMRLPENERDILNTRTIGKSILELCFGEGACLDIEDRYGIYMYEEGPKYIGNEYIPFEEFSIHQGVYSPADPDTSYGVSWTDTYSNDAHSIYLTFKFGDKNTEEWTNEQRESIQQKVMDVVRYLFQTEDVDAYFNDYASYESELNGQKLVANVYFKWGEFDGIETPTLMININTYV